MIGCPGSVRGFHAGLLASAIGIGCADERWPRPTAIPEAQFIAAFQEWREYRRSRLVRPGSGPVTWIGLWELHPGAVTVGADSTLGIVLPAGLAPGFAGTLHRSDADVRFEPAPGAGIQLADGTPINAPLTLASDRTDAPTVVAVGSLRLRVHGERGTDRLWLRAWDEEHPARDTFTLPEAFPLDTAWRVSARFEQFERPRSYRVADVTEGTQAYRSPGELVFRIGGAEHRLAAFADSGDTDFFVMIWDSTALTTTYQAGRYLHVPFPDADGWTEIDFNRTYNPPCVFTPYSTCAFPPPANRLRLAVNAGEKRLR